MKRIAYARSAAKALRKLPPEARADLLAKLERYVASGAGDVKRLVGRPVFRLRSGEYRLIFDEQDEEIVVQAVGHRRDIYR